MADRKKQFMVIDTDAGIDDAHAILMALADPSVQVVGITTVDGNTSLDKVVINVLRVMTQADRLDIPVYKGCDKALLGSTGQSVFHGKDGFGDILDIAAPCSSSVKSEHAVTALVRLANEYQGQLTLVTLGPLTNISLAIRMDPDFGKKLKHCYIMGGNYQGRGNFRTCSEYNFHCDPEAAHIVLNELGCSITMACWELCLRTTISWESYTDIFKVENKNAKFLDVIYTNAVKYLKSVDNQFRTADQIAMAAALDHEVVLAQELVYVTVELAGGYTRGQMVVDWIKDLGKEPNVNIISKLDHDMYVKMLKKVVQ